MDQIIHFSKCPRCEEKVYEVIKTYGHCVQCNYFSEQDIEAAPLIPKWVKDSVEEVTIPHSQENESEQSVA